MGKRLEKKSRLLPAVPVELVNELLRSLLNKVRLWSSPGVLPRRAMR